MKTPSATADSAPAHINSITKLAIPARYPPKRPSPPSKEQKMNRPYQSQPHLAPIPTTTYTAVNGTGTSAGPVLGYGSTLGFPTIHPNSRRRQQHTQQQQQQPRQHFIQSFADRPTPVQAGPVPKAATASPDIGRGHGWGVPSGNSNNSNNGFGAQYNSYPSQQQQKPQHHHNGQHEQQQQQAQKQHLSYPLSKGEYRHNYQYSNQDYYSNSGYADRHGYGFDSHWEESPVDSPPDLDIGYYLSQILQIPDMREQHQQEHYHMQQHSASSAVDMPMGMPSMHRSHKRVTFANPIATIADVEPMSLSDPVALLTCQPYRSALSKTLNQPASYASEYLGSAYAHDHEHCYDYNHDHRHDNNANGNGLAAYIEQKHRMQQQQQQQTQWHTGSQHHSEHRRRDSAKYAEENYASSSAKVRRRKSDYGPRMSVADGSAKPFKQYRYDDRFSLSMEHLPLYNHMPPS
ncbi:hypothetical protein GGI01_001802 [Coemansia sp. RSA 376]|nr:hypothetical protein GGI01_001802 [Coemansia sp. RSA 376]